MTHAPLTTSDDRTTLWRLALGMALVLLFVFLLSLSARAAEDDGGSIYRYRADEAVTNPVKGARKSNSISLSGIVAPLAAKAVEITAACGSKVVSSVRRGARVYGGSPSNHASGRAVDLQGNPTCIYAHLNGWAGGYSTDYWTAPGGPHVHISYNPNGMEWGLRFNHRKPRTVGKRGGA